MDRYHVNPKYRSALLAAGLGDFASAFSTQGGELASEADDMAEVRRITLPVAEGRITCYLKKSFNEPQARLLRSLAYGRRPHTGAIREYLLLKRLADHGFDVMEAMAWGESTRFGLPLRGFMLTREVSGIDADKIHRQGDAAARKQLHHDYGQLVGRLHAAGFFQPVRLKDMICRNADANSSGPFQLVLIDRATSKPWATLFRQAKSFSVIQRAFRRSSRDGIYLADAEKSAFAEGYCRAVSSRCNVTVGMVTSLLNETAAPAPAMPGAAVPTTPSGSARSSL